MPKIDAFRVSAPIVRGEARRELESVRVQLEGLKGARSAQVRLVLDGQGRLQALASGAKAPAQEKLHSQEAEDRLRQLLNHAAGPDQQGPAQLSRSRGELINLIDRYHQAPASGRTFHGAKLIYGRQQAPQPDRMDARTVSDFVRPEHIRQRALDALATSMGLEELPAALTNYLGLRGYQPTAQEVDSARDVARILRPPPAGQHRPAGQALRQANERPGDHLPLEQIRFDFLEAYELEENRASKMTSLNQSQALTSERWDALLQASSTAELDQVSQQIDSMPAIDAYLAPRGGRSLGKSIEHLFFKMGASVSADKGLKLGSARVARSLADLVGSVRREAAQDKLQPNWKDCADKAKKLASRVTALGHENGPRELNLHLEALLDRVDETDQTAHLGQPVQLQALSLALNQTLQELAANGAPQPMVKLLTDLSAKVAQRLRDHDPDRADNDQNQAEGAVQRGQLLAQARQALARKGAGEQLKGLLGLYREQAEFIGQQNLGLALLKADEPRFKAMLEGFGKLSEVGLASLTRDLAASGRAGLRLMIDLRRAAGGPLDEGLNATLHRLMPLTTVVSALSQSPETAARDWSGWMHTSTLSHSGPQTAIAAQARLQREQALKQESLVSQYGSFLQALRQADRQDLRETLRQEEPDFLRLEQLALGHAGRALAPGLTQEIEQAANAFAQAGRSSAARAQVRAQLEQALMKIPQEGQRFDDAQVACLAQTALDAVQDAEADPASAAAQLAGLLPPAITLRALTALESQQWPDDGLGSLHKAFISGLKRPVVKASKAIDSARQGDPSPEVVQKIHADFLALQGLLLTYGSIPEGHPSLASKELRQVKELAIQVALAQRSTARQWLMHRPELAASSGPMLQTMATAELPAFVTLEGLTAIGPDGLAGLSKPLMDLLEKHPADALAESAQQLQDRLMMPGQIAQALEKTPERQRLVTLVGALESVWHWDRAQGQRLIAALPAPTLRTYADQMARMPSDSPMVQALQGRLQSARTQTLERLHALAERIETGNPPTGDADLPALLGQAYLDAQCALELRSHPDASASAATMTALRADLKRIAGSVTQRIASDPLWLADNTLENHELGLMRLALIACGSIFDRDLRPDRESNPFDDPQSAVSRSIVFRFKADEFPGLADTFNEAVGDFCVDVGDGADTLQSEPLAPELAGKVRTFVDKLRQRLADKYDGDSDMLQEFGSHISESLRFVLLPEHQSNEPELGRHAARGRMITGSGDSMRKLVGGLRTYNTVDAVRTLYELAAVNPQVRKVLEDTAQQCQSRIQKGPPLASDQLMLEMLESLKAMDKANRLTNPSSPVANRFEQSLKVLLVDTRGPKAAFKSLPLAEWQKALFTLEPELTNTAPQERGRVASRAAESAISSVRQRGSGLSYTGSKELLRKLPSWKPNAGFTALVHETLKSIAARAELELTDAVVVDPGQFKSLHGLRMKKPPAQSWDLVAQDLRNIKKGEGFQHQRTDVETNAEDRAGLAALRYFRLIENEDPDALNLMTTESLKQLSELLKPAENLWPVRELQKGIVDAIRRKAEGRAGPAQH